ncbi:MAG: LLM class flavin-dependent oxidoreductase [Candidatus Limnocylindria bacterium]
MNAFDLGRLGVWGHLDSLSATDAAAYVRRAEELGYGTLWVPETVGREPIALLGYLAASTDRIHLGTSIVNIWGRDAQAARMAARTLAEASAGRFVLGLGVSHPHLAGKLRGHRFERPLSRMRDYLAAYRGAVYHGPGASHDAAEPPVMIAALREKMTDLAATDADGALPYLVTVERVAWMRQRLDAAALGDHPQLAVTLPVVIGDPGDRNAARAYLRPYLRTPTYQASWELQGFGAPDWESPASDRLVDAMIAVGSVEDVRRRIDELHAAGADHVAIIPLAPDGVTEHLETLEALGA